MNRFNVVKLCGYFCVTDAQNARNGILYESKNLQNARRYYNCVVAAVGNVIREKKLLETKEVTK